MIRNYFTVALRNILKHKLFAVINILGMTIGLTACLLIVLYVGDELSFDRFHADADRIYQVGLHGKMGGQDIRVTSTCPPMAAALTAEIPEIESSTRIAQFFGKPAVKYEEKVFAEDQVLFVDSNFFEFFSFTLLEGNPKTVLREINSAVLTPAIATKYFGDEPAVGKMLTIGSKNQTYKVTGIVQEAPSNSHVQFTLLLSAASNENLQQTAWLNNFMYTYFKVHRQADVTEVNAKFSGLVEKYVGPEVERFMGISIQQMKEQGGEYGYFSTLLTDLHLRSTAQGGLSPAGNIMYVYFFGGIGIFILIIACINFMNLSTAQSAGRAKEVGLRKTLGSQRGQMVGQFLAESTFYSFIAVALSVLFCYLLLPQFNSLSGKTLEIGTLGAAQYVLGLAGLVLLVGVVAGSYPAFYLTSFSAVEVLKGKLRAGMKSKGVRSSLVVFQFALSIFLMIFTAVVFQQVRYLQEQNLGIDKNNILVVNNTGRLKTNKEAFRNSLTQHAGIVTVSYSNNNFPGVNSTTVFKEAVTEQDHIMGLYYADYDHQDVMRFELLEGRYFSRDFPSDSLGIILNEAAVREFNFDEALNSEILYNDGGDTFKRYTVVGVMKNFNFESFKSEVRPLAIMLGNDLDNLMIRYSGSSAQALAQTEKLWKEYAAGEPFEYEFLDESFDRLFRAEQRMGTIFGIFSGLAIFVACLGLFALSAFTSEQRTKEIGIRKAMGASSYSVMFLLSKEFTRLVLIAFVPAAAAGWYISDNWLQEFAYRVDVNPVIIVVSGTAAIGIAWLTVSYQAVRTAMLNPVKSLRYE
jgi:putative ABC transport system permease protein